MTRTRLRIAVAVGTAGVPYETTVPDGEASAVR